MTGQTGHRLGIIARMAEIEKGWHTWPLPAYSTVLDDTEVEWLELSRRLRDSIRRDLLRPVLSHPGRSPLCGCMVCGCLKRYCNCSCCCQK